MRRPALLLALGLALGACDGPDPVVPPQPVQTASATSATAAPADPAPVTDGDVTVASANDVQILIKRIPGAELAAMQLYIRGGAGEWTAADAGITELALSVATSGGTATLGKDAYHRRLAALGSEIGSQSGPDYASISAKSLVASWDDTFALLADSFLHPALPKTELELQRQRQIAAIKHEQETPDGALGLLVHAATFKGHPFENRSQGTEESVSALTLDAVSAHLSKLRETGRLLFVTVGDVEPGHVVAKVRAAFGALPRGAWRPTEIPSLSFDKPIVRVTDRKLPTNYIEAVFPGPRWTSPELPDAMVAMSLLGYRVFQEVRTKRNLSYAPAAYFTTGSSVPRGFLYVTAVDPNTTIKVMLDEVKKLRDEPVPDKDLGATKSVYLTGYLMQNESTDGQARMLGDAQLLGGDWRLARTLPDRVRAVTAASVQAFAKKYLRNLQFVVLGDQEKIDTVLFGSI